MRPRSTRSRGYILAALGAALAVFTASACSSSPTSSSGSSGQKPFFRMGTDSTIDSLNPMVAFQATAIWVHTNIYPYLLNYNKNAEIIPSFARSWKASDGGRTYTFHTVPNAEWSDGKPLTAKDAAWTINTLVKYKSGPTSYWEPQVLHITKADAPNDNTLVVHYNKPIATALSNILQFPILPEHVWGKLATGNGKELKTYPNTPQNGKPLVSGGPFMLTKYQKDQLAILQANPHWWGPKPHISGFGIQIFSNSDAMLSAFKNGQIDAIDDVPNTAVDTLKKAGFVVRTTPGNFFYDFIINSNPKKPEHRELLNVKLREAFEYAIDRQRIVNVALNGFGTIGATIVPATTGKWHDSNVKPLPFDLAKANGILDSLGFKRGSNGIRVADGHPMSYQVIVPNSRTDVLTPTFRVIQGDFRKIGISLQEKVLDPNGAFEAITAPNDKYLNFDLAMWDWIPGEDPDSILSVLLCNQYGSNSDTGYCSPAYDRLYREQAEAIDVDRRVQIVHEMQAMIAHDRPYIVLNYPDVIQAYTKNWTGFYDLPGEGIFDVYQSMLDVHTTS